MTGQEALSAGHSSLLPEEFGLLRRELVVGEDPLGVKLGELLQLRDHL